MERRRERSRQEAIAFIGNHLPRQCGIATFTTDLANAVRREVRDKYRSFVVAMNDRPEGYDYPSQVKVAIGKEESKDYLDAADYLNANRVNVACLQHEYGIFGGDDGENILLLLRDMRPPLVTTLHTILQSPSPGQSRVIDEVMARSSKVVVMSRRGEHFLKSVYKVPDEKIAFIHHGIPDIEFGRGEHYKASIGLSGRRVVLTFGLLSPNKGVEYMLRGLPPIVRKHPDVVYVILGATHPEIRRRSGDEYRYSLRRLARSLGVEDNVIFQSRFVNLSELCDFLAATDIYVTSYLNREQITSGTLAYALGAGCAIVSTPYWYAEELLEDGRGQIVPFREIEPLTDGIMRWLDDPAELARVRERAYKFTRKMVWKEVAREYTALFEQVAQREPVASRPRILKRPAIACEIPPPKLDHLVRLTDDTGLIQHAKYNVPDPAHGYATDDNARATVVVTRYNWLFDSAQAVGLLARYLAFLRYCQIDDGRFHGLVSYHRSFLDTVGTNDALGRAVWGLGYATAYAPEGYWQPAKEMFDRATGNLNSLGVRGWAYSLLGLHYYLRKFPDATDLRDWAKRLVDNVVSSYRANADDNWRWFEPVILYDNALIPHALFLAHDMTGLKDCLPIAEESLDFLTGRYRRGGHFSLVGCNGWYPKDGNKADFDQQPIDACSLVGAYWAAYKVTGETRYLGEMLTAYDWFFGANDLEVPLYDFESGGCSDGLTPEGPNRNRGAESTLSYLMATLDMIEMSSATSHDFTKKERALKVEDGGVSPVTKEGKTK
ncbi:MAG: glycosyltransferase family 4 protein [Planctomycetota bacterium]